MNTDVMFSSKTDAWATPKAFFRELDEEFHFNLDPCADEFNHKCDRYFTVKENGLSQDWGGSSVFCNPPYGREIGKWVEKAYRTNQEHGNLVVSKNSAPFPSMVVIYKKKEGADNGKSKGEEKE